MNHAGVKNTLIQTLMVPTALKLPLWNGSPIFFATFKVPIIEKKGVDLVRIEDPVPPNLAPWGVCDWPATDVAIGGGGIQLLACELGGVMISNSLFQIISILFLSLDWVCRVFTATVSLLNKLYDHIRSVMSKNIGAFVLDDRQFLVCMCMRLNDFILDNKQNHEGKNIHFVYQFS